MEGKNLARIGAIVFIAFAITATAIEMTREGELSPPAAAPTLAPSVDLLRAEQRRCQQMGEAAARDPECLAVWAETRDRFLGRSPSDSVQRDSEDQ